MATLAPPSPSRSPARMPRKWARKVERYCCLGLTYFPLLFVYSITTWAVWVEATIGFLPSKSAWIGKGSSFLGITLYILLNWSYTTAVFTSPGTTTAANDGYSSLPTHAPPAATNFTVKSNGELRFCKKCQARKPDRAHHCSTCRKCVLKMDHHCPWLATCVGLKNYKAFLLFLIYTTLFCFLDVTVSGSWVWSEILNDGEYTESLMPVNYVMLMVISGIIGIVLAGFTGWHILLASRGQTTIECLEKTRYLSPLRKAMQNQHISQIAQRQADSEQEQPEYGQQMNDLQSHTPISQQANGEITMGQPRYQSYDQMERRRARERYEEYLDEQDSEKLPSAFDLGRRKNLLHLFGPKKLLWAFPICTTTGDGWSWEPSPKWLAAREKIAREREEQRARERAAGWGEEAPSYPQIPDAGAGRHYLSTPRANPQRTMSKADKILGRDPSQYADEGNSGARLGSSAVSMHTLNPRDDMDDDSYDISSDEDAADRKGIDRISPHWPQNLQKVGILTNSLLGNTIGRKKDDVKGWDGINDEVD